jgi:hypothetical protein
MSNLHVIEGRPGKNRSRAPGAVQHLASLRLFEALPLSIPSQHAVETAVPRRAMRVIEPRHNRLPRFKPTAKREGSKFVSSATGVSKDVRAAITRR